jgi:phosphatidylethanolamine/phosphatidyl-N-methylethanolamine N-methyltransferase
MGLYMQFLKGLWADPRGVSAPTPSSHALAAAIAAKVNPFLPGLVVELGAGTGAVTAALMARGVTADRIVAFESSDHFCALLHKRFPGIRIVRGDALTFDRHLEEGDKIAAVVSGLPLLHLAPCVRQDLIERSLDRQGPHGRFVQLSYGWVSAVPAATRKFAVSKQIVWRNIPPAHVWTYIRAARSAPRRTVPGLASRQAAPS